MTPRLADGRAVYPTYDAAAAAQARQQRDHGVMSGIVASGDGWTLRFDVSAGAA